MAKTTVVSAFVVVCPQCHFVAIIRAWACGCMEVFGGRHSMSCPGLIQDLQTFSRKCGQVGDNPRDHVIH